MFFTVCMFFFALYFGIDWIRKCTWSLSVPISMNSISYLFSIPKQVSLNTSSTSSLNTTLRYFAGYIKWLIKIVML